MHATATKAAKTADNAQTETAVRKTAVIQSPEQMPLWADVARPIQFSLKVNTPGDKYEQEADRVAKQVMKYPDQTSGNTANKLRPPLSISNTFRRPQTTGVMRQIEIDEESIIGELVTDSEEIRRAYNGKNSENGVDRKAQNGVFPDSIQKGIRNLHRSGRQLAPAEKTFMESRFGYNFDSVRIHTDADSAGLAQALNARAFTIGDHIVFGDGEYRPQVAAGRTLLAHELTHVVQQVPGTSRMIYRSEAEESPPMSRSEEIRLSRTSPGQAVIQSAPAALSLYNFGIDRAQPKSYHRQLLNEFARFVSREITIPVRIRVVGHASAPGTIPHNIDLGRRRAEQVAGLLQAAGLSNVNTFTGGETAPVASNDTVEGRTRNRRVDIMLSPTPIPGPTPTPTPEPTPTPTPEPPRPERPERPEEPDFCDRYPLLCGLIPPFIPIIPIPIPWQLICILAPELCLLIPCMINPAACIPGPPDIPEPPDRPDRRDPPPRVEFWRVRAFNTPVAMRDRIPDQGSTLVAAIVTGYRPSMPPIQIEPVGANSLNGEFQINGGLTTSITGTTLLSVGGTSQTTSAAAGHRLQLRATMAASQVGISEPFAVAAIMENMRTSLEDVVIDWTNPVANERGVGLVTRMSWDSDGANGLRSLNEMEYGEQLAIESESGGMAGMGLGAHGFLALADQEQTDYHGTEEAYMRRAGQQTLMQLHTLVSYRTGETAEDIVVNNSGFKITREVAPDPGRPGCFQFKVAKFGAAATVASFRSGAGSGRAEATVPIPCGGGGGSRRSRPPRGGDGGGGTTPSTLTIPLPHIGPLPRHPTGATYGGGIPVGVTPGTPVIITILFVADSTDPARPETRLFRSPVPCMVENVTSTHVILRTTNPVSLSLAPSGFTLTVLRPSTPVQVPLSLIH